MSITPTLTSSFSESMAANVLHFQIPLEIPFDSMLLLVWFYFTTFTLQYRIL